MCLCEQWWLHCTSQWGWWMQLSEHVYCVAITFKVAEQVEQRICIKFCVKLEQSSMETIGMIQKAAVMGNWRWAASSRQHACSCMSCAEYFGETSSHPGDSAPHTRFGAVWLLAFPKTKITFERKRLQTVSEIQGNTMGQPMAIGKTVGGPEVPTLEETEALLSYVQCFLCLPKWMCLFFILLGWIPLDRLLYQDEAEANRKYK